jgi:hypothetical protein
LAFIKKLLKSLSLSFLPKKVPKERNLLPTTKSSKAYALERLKEIHNYDYSTFAANHYRTQNHTVWEYSKEKNLVNYPLNLVMKREKDILLIKCRSNINEITLYDLLEFEKIGAEFVAQYALFKNYNILYLCICSEDRFTNEALEYIANNNNISYEILREFEE